MENLNTNYATEKQLTMPREKPRSLIISVSYRLIKIGRIIIGKQRLLRWCLNSSWLLRRFAFEISGELYGGSFHCHAKALSEDFLKNHIPENGTVIDIGCGIGRWCRIASKYAKSVVGIDYDENLIRQAKEETTAANVEYLVGDVSQNLQNRKFDLALLIHVIEHIENADSILRELKNVSTMLIVEVPDFEYDSLNWVRLEQKCSFYSDGDHVREYTLDILTDQLDRNGWQVLEHKKHGGAVLVVAKLAENFVK